jgi:hypothetical protein
MARPPDSPISSLFLNPRRVDRTSGLRSLLSVPYLDALPRTEGGKNLAQVLFQADY